MSQGSKKENMVIYKLTFLLLYNSSFYINFFKSENRRNICELSPTSDEYIPVCDTRWQAGWIRRWNEHCPLTEETTTYINQQCMIVAV